MNKKQRDEIQAWVGQLDEIKENIAQMQQDECEKYDNMSEGLQQSEVGQMIEAAATALDNAVTSLDDVISHLEEAMG